MKRFLQFLTVVCLAAMPSVFVSCDDANDDSGKGGKGTLTFKVEVSVNGQEAVVDVTPSNNDDYYVVGNAATWMVEGEDAYADSIEDYAAMYVALLIDADEEGWVETNSDTVGKGAKTVVFDSLAEDEYTAFVVGVNTADGTLTTEVVTATFEIKATAVELPELLTLTLGDYDAQSVSVDVAVDAEYTGWYMVAVYEAEWVDTFDSFETFMAQQALVQQGNNLSEFAYQGSQNGITCATGDAKTKYYVMAAGVNEDYELTTAVAYADFTTPEKDEQNPGPGGDEDGELTFIINLDPLEDGCYGSIVPSNPNATYFYFLAQAYFFEPVEEGGDGYTREEWAEMMIPYLADAEEPVSTGYTEFEMHDYFPDDYVFFVVAFDEEYNLVTYETYDFHTWVDEEPAPFVFDGPDEDGVVTVTTETAETTWAYFFCEASQISGLIGDYAGAWDGNPATLVQCLLDNGFEPSQVYTGSVRLSFKERAESEYNPYALVAYLCTIDGMAIQGADAVVAELYF